MKPITYMFQLESNGQAAIIGPYTLGIGAAPAPYKPIIFDVMVTLVRLESGVDHATMDWQRQGGEGGWVNREVALLDPRTPGDAGGALLHSWGFFEPGMPRLRPGKKKRAGVTFAMWIKNAYVVAPPEGTVLVAELQLELTKVKAKLEAMQSQVYRAWYDNR